MLEDSGDGENKEGNHEAPSSSQASKQWTQENEESKDEKVREHSEHNDNKDGRNQKGKLADKEATTQGFESEQNERKATGSEKSGRQEVEKEGRKDGHSDQKTEGNEEVWSDETLAAYVDDILSKFDLDSDGYVGYIEFRAVSRKTGDRSEENKSNA